MCMSEGKRDLSKEVIAKVHILDVLSLIAKM